MRRAHLGLLARIRPAHPDPHDTRLMAAACHNTLRTTLRMSKGWLRGPFVALWIILFGLSLYKHREGFLQLKSN